MCLVVVLNSIKLSYSTYSVPCYCCAEIYKFSSFRGNRDRYEYAYESIE